MRQMQQVEDLPAQLLEYRYFQKGGLISLLLTLTCVGKQTQWEATKRENDFVNAFLSETFATQIHLVEFRFRWAEFLSEEKSRANLVSELFMNVEEVRA